MPTAELPQCSDLLLVLDGPVLHVTLNRPKARNAMSMKLVDELEAVFDSIVDDRDIRAVVLRGAEGNFCAGGDIKDMAKSREAEPVNGKDPVAAMNRRFGDVITKVDGAPQAVIAVIEGAVLGGGFGLSCASDVAIAHKDATFGLPETGLGIPPAQIAPFVVKRIGLTQARRLGVCGGRFQGAEAERIGLVHFVCDSTEEIDALLAKTLKQIRRCAPKANAMTKKLMLKVGSKPLDQILDEAADDFAICANSEEGAEGMMAFIEKRQPKWA